jgi:ribosomal protein L37AE/L43A
MTDQWRCGCPECGSVSLYGRTTGTYRCKQCTATFAKRYDKKRDRLV